VLQRLIAAVLAVLGLAAIGLGVASATAWRADDPLVATAAPGGGTRTLVTDPGVLELAGDPVTVTVRAEGAPVVLALGRDTDVTAWVGSDPYVRVTGLSDWHTLSTTAVAAPEPTASPSASTTPGPSPSPSPSGAAGDEAGATAADPTGNDMWVVEVTGDGSATLEWPAQDGRWSLLAVSLGDTAPVLDLSWPQTVTTPWLWPGVALGVLLLAAAAILLVRILRRRREGPDTGWHSVTTGQLAVVPAPGTDAGPGAPAPAGTPTGAVPVGTISATGAPLTRRQIREAEAEAAAAAAAARRRGRRNATGAVPTVTGAIPAVTGAVPAVTGAVPTATGAASTASGSTPAAGGTAPEAGAPPQPSAPAPAVVTPSSTGRRPGSAARPDGARTAEPAASEATSDRPAAATREQAAAATGDAAPPDAAGTEPGTTAGTAPGRGAQEPAAPDRPRGVTARLPWRRSRPEPAAGPAVPPSAPGTPEVPAATGPETGSATSWSPVPGAPAGAGRAAVPPTTPAPLGGTPAGDDDPAAQAQRADAWRRMWGFPSDAAGATDGGSTDDDEQHGTEEGR